MEPGEIQAALAGAVEEVLDTMCFACVFESAAGPAPENPEAGGPSAAGAVFRAAVRFEGKFSGGFFVNIPGPLARAVGAGFLGREEDEVSESESGEVVGELTNMFCGSVLGRMEGSELFRLTHPEVRNAAGPGQPRGESRWFDLGDGVLSVSLEIERAA